MSSGTGGLVLVRRVLAERRRFAISLGLLLVANVVVYGVAVYPLSQRVANIEQRDRTAERSLRAAKADYAGARNTLTGKERAAAELATFYKDVLPQSWSDARRMTHLRLQQLARESNLDFERYTSEPVQEKGSSLTRVKIELVLRGKYDAVRAFVYKLDTSPEFVVIDDIGLAEGSDSSGVLVLTLQLSTYFRLAVP